MYVCIPAGHVGLLHAQVICIKSVARSLETMLEGWQLRLEGQVPEVHQQKAMQNNRVFPYTVHVPT